MRKRHFLFLYLFFFICCESSTDSDRKTSQNFSIFVAGHVYGRAGANHEGVHPPLRPHLRRLGKDSLFAFGVYTGDIVGTGATEVDWDEIDLQIDQFFGKPIYFAAGNHDIEDRTFYENRYGETYYTFDRYHNRFIFIDGNMCHWNISGEQLELLNEALDNLENIENVFIFMHQVIWWHPHTKYEKLRLNSHEGYLGIPNYWEEIHPKLQGLKTPVYLIAGDIGAASWSSSLMYDKLDNVHLIASGMGSDDGDNIVELNVANGVVEVKFRFLYDSTTLVPSTFVIQ